MNESQKIQPLQKKNTVNVSISLSRELLAKIDKAAQESERNRSKQIAFFCKLGVNTAALLSPPPLNFF